MSRRGFVALASFVAILGSACAIMGTGTPEDGVVATSANGDSATQEPADSSMLPVSINEGLASLDSYLLTFITDVFDSTVLERTVTTFVVASDRERDASYNRTETVVTTEGGEVVSEDGQEQYIIGNSACTLAEGEAQFSTISDTARVMSDLMSQVVDFKPLIENPVSVGQDVVNGVPVRTYTFEIRSLRAASEAEATRADGSYAVAEDGNYMVAYRLDLELRTAPEGDPEAEYSISSFDLSLEQINQPVDIEFPELCLEAQTFQE